MVNELDGNGAFADAGSDALNGAMAHIADDEDAGDAGFKERGIAIDAPALGALAVAQEIGAGEYEATSIALDEVAEPVGARQGADEDEEAFGGDAIGALRGGAVD